MTFFQGAGQLDVEVAWNVGLELFAEQTGRRARVNPGDVPFQPDARVHNDGRRGRGRVAHRVSRSSRISSAESEWVRPDRRCRISAARALASAIPTCFEAATRISRNSASSERLLPARGL